jgi:hypothetical protein
MVKRKTRRGSPLHLTGAFDLFKPSKEIILKNIWVFGPLYAVPVIFWIHSWIWSPASPTNSHWFDVFYGHGNLNGNWASTPISNLPDTFVGFSIFWLLIVLIAGTIAQLMTVIALFEGSEGKTPSFDKLWKSVRKFGLRMVGLYLLTGLYTVLGFFCLIYPGLVMIRRYFLAPYVLLDKDCGVREAMKRSAEISKPSESGNWSLSSRGIWTIIGVTFLIGLIGIIPLIGSLIAFVVAMFYAVAPALRYQELKKIS